MKYIFASQRIGSVLWSLFVCVFTSVHSATNCYIDFQIESDVAESAGPCHSEWHLWHSIKSRRPIRRHNCYGCARVTLSVSGCTLSSACGNALDCRHSKIHAPQVRARTEHNITINTRCMPGRVHRNSEAMDAPRRCLSRGRAAGPRSLIGRTRTHAPKLQRLPATETCYARV